MKDSTEPKHAAHTPLTARVPGYNVDRIDIEAGLQRLRKLGYDNPNAAMEVEYNLWRWARGEEGPADNSMSRSLTGVSYTDWRVILAAARATAESTAAAELGK